MNNITPFGYMSTLFYEIPYLFVLSLSCNPKIEYFLFHYKQSVFIYITFILPYTTFMILVEYYKN